MSFQPGRLARRSQGSESEREEAEWGRGEARAAAEPEARAGPAEEPGRPATGGHFHPAATLMNMLISLGWGWGSPGVGLPSVVEECLSTPGNAAPHRGGVGWGIPASPVSAPPFSWLSASPCTLSLSGNWLFGQ